MAIQYDPRLQGKPNTTDILTGQEDLSQQQQEGSQAAPQAAQPQGNAQAAQPQQNAPQSNLATNKPKASSGMFTNVRQYIEKNKPAAQNMAKSIGSTVQRSADIARKNIQASQSQFGNLMEQGSLANRGSAVSDVRSAAERAAGMSAPQQTQAGQSQVDQIINAPAPQETIQPTPDMANQATGGVRSTKASPAFGTERDGQYYVGTGSSSQLNDIISGNFGNNRTIHTNDYRDMWVDKDTYDAYNEYRNSQDFTNRTSKDFNLNLPISPYMPTPIGEEVKTAAQKDFLGDKYDQYRKDMDEALSNFVPGDDESLSNLSKVEESYGLTGNWFDSYKDRKFDYKNNIFEDQESQVETPAMSDADARIKSILDAQYKGPQRLEELGSFGQAQSKAQEAERLRAQLTGGNRQELLDKALERRGSQYTQGARRLDELLFGQGDPQQYLQQTQQQIGDVGQDLSSASQSARQDAINRARELSDIRSQAREALQSTATGRAGEVQSAIDAQIAAGGELADYYKNLLSESEGGLDLGSIEAQTLGVQSGAGLYNLLRDEQEREALLSNLDARDRLEAEKLISRDEQAQLAELQRLAQLSSDYGVADSGLDFRTQYQDADLAGTQDALAALNLEGFGDALTEAETRFREQAAQDVTGIGRGKAKYNRGMGRGRKKVKRTAYETANLKDILQDQGYDFESDPSQYVSEADTSILKDLSAIASKAKGEELDISDPDGLVDMLSGFMGSDSIIYNNEIMDALGLSGLSNILTLGGATQTAGNVVSSLGQTMQDFESPSLPGPAGVLGTPFTAGLDAVGEVTGGILNTLGSAYSDISSSVFGGGKGAAKKKAAAKARRAALADLQRKLTGKLSSSGFSNRVNVADTEETTERQRQLLDILGGIRNK